MPNPSDRSNRNANDNLYTLKAGNNTARTFDPSHFESLMDQRLSESQASTEQASDQPICHVY